MKPYYDQDGIAIYHGDCREVAAKFASESVDLLIADPPYGISYVSNNRQIKFDSIVGDEQVNVGWLSDVKRLMRLGKRVYVFADDSSLCQVRDGLTGIGWTLSRMLVWDKGNMTKGALDDYGSRTEYLVAGWAGSSSDRGFYGSRDPNLIAVPKVDPRVLVHPAEKPEALLSYLIVRCTDIDDLILDPFMGSGSTLAAARTLGRRAIGIEIEERYCEIAVQRLAQGVLAFGGFDV